MTAINSNRAIRGPVTAVPVVAGKGVRLVADTENNRWVVEADETVLWEGDDTITDACSGFTLSENASHFERLRFYGHTYGDTWVEYECPASKNASDPLSITYTYYCASSDSSPAQCRQSNFSTSDGLVYTVSTKKFVYGTDPRYSGGNTTQGAPIYKIVGINRIASN